MLFAGHRRGGRDNDAARLLRPGQPQEAQEDHERLLRRLRLRGKRRPFPGITRRNFSNAICALQRCADPTECGTFVSGVTCEACEVGTMLPIDSLDVYSGKLLS